MWLPVATSLSWAVIRTRSPLAHATLDHVADAQLLGDLLHMDGPVLVDKGRVARDHEEPTQLGQRGDDVLADAIGEILLLRFPAHVDEGKHGDGRSVR